MAGLATLSRERKSSVVAGGGRLEGLALVHVAPVYPRPWSMIRKSGHRFSEKIMLKTKSSDHVTEASIRPNKHGVVWSLTKCMPPDGCYSFTALANFAGRFPAA
jgi:hypothetical protein